MKLSEAIEILQPLQSKNAANIAMARDIGVVKEAIRVVFSRESATQDQILLASTVQAAIMTPTGR